ncbi:hypothetical protein [Ferrimonas senticii]|uniref:hypothetical protein n=1 Tax=Ferrimonas senticii TaxID=394566 RepID=UPI00040B8D9E|nr:hypothetical protein [Ferrimonas senticii]
MTTLIVMFNLKEGVSEADYLQWAKQSDLPTVNSLNSVQSFEVFKGENLFGSNEPSPYHYFEVIKLHSVDGFAQELTTAAMQQIIAQFQAFTEDAKFVATSPVTA